MTSPVLPCLGWTEKGILGTAPGSEILGTTERGIVTTAASGMRGY